MNTKHLKAKILDLAIRGKLVPQDPSEGNAADLLKKIREEKSILIEQKKIKADKNSSFIIKADDGRHYEHFADGNLIDIEDDIPFEIPENWCWCRLTQICEYGKCQNAEPADLDPNSWILDLEDIEKDTGKIKQFKIFEERNSLSTKHVFTEGTVLYSKLRPYLNKVVIAPKDGFCTSEILPLDFQGLYINKFAQRLLMSPYFLSTVNMLTYGVKMPRLGTNEAKQIFVPLPPLSEQQRIVSAIEKAFEQIDIIEKNKLNLKTYIKQTKSKVLDLAIRGKLVKQNPSEGNATDLLKIQNVLVESEIPFVIPETWCWCRLGNCSSIISKGTTPKGGKNAYKKDGINFLRIENLNDDGSINHSNIFHISVEDHEGGLKRSKLEAGDLLISIAGTLGKVGFVTEADLPINTNQAIAFLRLRKNIFDNMYLKYAIESSFINSELLSKTKVTSIPNLTLEIISNCLIPLPPLDEQQRIVKNIKQIFEQLNILEKSLGQ